MTQRLVTEYRQARIQLSMEQLSQFIAYASDPHIHLHIRVLDNGNQEFRFGTRWGEEVQLPFAWRDGYYVCELSCELVNVRLSNLIRRLFIAFHGTGLVLRTRGQLALHYTYRHGTVEQILECEQGHKQLIYTHQSDSRRLQKLYDAQTVETDIALTCGLIDTLLDRRNEEHPSTQLVDKELAFQLKRLLKLES
ncbi:non-ribosomal peptide synthetase module [Paenibacillus sp. WLX1005]|uniref:non-ribosomal peptide synthetase module n=1 Tax=Paenibacillus sp. WLX1005 TaxID=3243766 RepID=UPI0039845DB0